MKLTISLDAPAKLNAPNIQRGIIPNNMPINDGITASTTHGIIITYCLILGLTGKVDLQ